MPCACEDGNRHEQTKGGDLDQHLNSSQVEDVETNILSYPSNGQESVDGFHGVFHPPFPKDSRLKECAIS